MTWACITCFCDWKTEWVCYLVEYGMASLVWLIPLFSPSWLLKYLFSLHSIWGSRILHIFSNIGVSYLSDIFQLTYVKLFIATRIVMAINNDWKHLHQITFFSCSVLFLSTHLGNWNKMKIWQLANKWRKQNTYSFFLRHILDITHTLNLLQSLN